MPVWLWTRLRHWWQLLRGWGAMVAGVLTVLGLLDTIIAHLPTTPGQPPPTWHWPHLALPWWLFLITLSLLLGVLEKSYRLHRQQQDATTNPASRTLVSSSSPFPRTFYPSSRAVPKSSLRNRRCRVTLTPMHVGKRIRRPGKRRRPSSIRSLRPESMRPSYSSNHLGSKFPSRCGPDWDMTPLLGNTWGRLVNS
jgi:hypothetical protein